MATKPNIDRLYEKLFSIKEMLIEVIQTANETANDANSFGGEIARVIPNQLRTILVPTLQQYIDSPSNPVAIDSIVRFLDSLPLSKVRIGHQDSTGPGGADMGITPMSPDAIGAAAAAGMPPPAPTGAMTGLQANAAAMPEEGMYESAILKAKGQELLDIMRERWEDEHPEQPLQDGVLDFSMIKEDYQRRPSTPEIFSRNNEDKIYQRVVEVAQKKPSKLQEADMLVSPYAKQDISDMSGWRDLVESYVLDSEINERLGAGAVADALLSEGTEEGTKAGIARMRELVSPRIPATDAGDVAALLASGRISEADDSLSSDHIRDDSEDDDLTALVNSDSREPV